MSSLQAALISSPRQFAQQFTLLQAAFDASTDWIFVKDRKFRYLLANRAYANALGLVAEDIVGKDDLEIGFSADVVFGNEAQGLNGFRASSAAAMAGATVHQQEVAVTTNGTRYIMDVKKTPLRHADGEIYAVLGIARDVTDQVQAETRLRLFEQAIAASTIGIVLADAQQPDLPATYVNPAFETYTGYSSAEVIGQNFRFLQGSDTNQPELDRLRAALKAGKSSTITLRNYRKDGSLFWNELTVSPIFDAQQRITHFVGFQQDVSDRKAAEVALSKSETKFRRLVEDANDVITVWTLNGIVTYLSPKFVEFSGYETTEFVGKSFTPLIHPDDLPAVLRFNQEVADTGQKRSNFEFRRINKSGQVRWVTLSITPVKHANGQVVGFQGILRDVTERKTAEAALSLSQQRLAALIQQAPIGIIEWTPTGRVKSWNTAAENIFGFSAAAALGQPFEFIVPENSKQHITEIFANSLTQQGDTCSINDNITQTGQIINCEWHNRPLLLTNQTAAHEVIGLLSMVIDVTDRKRNEAQLKQQEQTLRAIIDNAACWIWMINPQGKLQLVNRRFSEDVGVPEPVLLAADHYQEVLDLEAQKLFIVSDQVALNSAQPVQSNELMQLADGQLHAMEVVKTQIQDDTGQVVGMIGIAVDVTKQKQIEADLRDREQLLHQQAEDLFTTLKELQRTQAQLVQSEKMSSLGQLVAGVAHEINNPVSFIYGNLTYLAEHTQDLLSLVQTYQQTYPDPNAALATKIAAIDLNFILQDLPRLLGSMKIGAERIQEIVLSLRTFSRLDEADYKEADIHQGIDSALLILQHRLKAQEQRPAVQITKAYGDLPLVYCYAGQLNQVFMNILVNAIDALEEDWATEQRQQRSTLDLQITISTAIKNDVVVIRIADNGSGVTEEVQHQLFNPFFTTKPIGKGTGMGLSVSYQIITENHKGSLECFSTLGQGAEFVITIPLQLAL
jgi:PAS domain S-box-containing protein